MHKHLSNISPGLNANKPSLHDMDFCERHQQSFAKTMYLPGLKKYLRSHCPQCLETEQQQQVENEMAEAKKRQLEKQRKQADIPMRFQQKHFADYAVTHEQQKLALEITQTYAEQFAERLHQGGGLILLGKPGTGKTHLACAIAHHLLQEGYSLLFSTLMAMLRKFKATFHPQAKKTEQEILQHFSQPALLILDEVGMQHGTETEKLILFEILNARYEAVLPTIFISNLTKEELTHYVGERVMDRQKEGGGVFVRFDWESYRN